MTKYAAFRKNRLPGEPELYSCPFMATAEYIAFILQKETSIQLEIVPIEVNGAREKKEE